MSATARSRSHLYGTMPLPAPMLAAILVVLAAGRSFAATTVLFEDDFEGAFPDPNWGLFGSPAAYDWGLTTYRTPSGSGHSVYCVGKTIPAPGPYVNSMRAWMDYGPFDLSGCAYGTVTFRYWLDTQTGKDYLKWGYSTDGSSYSVYSTATDTVGWATATLGLANEGLCGEPAVWFAIIFQSDNKTVAEGAYVDDVVITVGNDDIYEENDTYMTAWNFTGGENQWLSAYGGEKGIKADDDWYKIYVPAGREHVIVDLTFTHAEGDIDIGLHNASGQLLASSWSTTDNEHIDYVVSGAGTYYLNVRYQNMGNEYDLKWVTIADKPDLVITAIAPSNSNPGLTDTISVDVTVRNLGVADAGPFKLDLYYHRTAPPTTADAGNQSKNLTGLAAGGTTTATFTAITYGLVLPPTSPWSMYAQVDRAAAVVETDETNNVAGPTTVVWSDNRPDLTVTSVTAGDSTPAAGGSTTVTVRIDNLNAIGDAGSFRVDLFHDRASPPSVGETGNQYQTVPGLAGGGNVECVFPITSAVPDDWTVYAIVDTLNGVNESTAGGEANNVGGPEAVQWRGVDLEVVSITPTNANPLVGAAIDVSVSVRNNGNVTSASFDLGLFCNRASAPAPGAAADRTLSGLTVEAGHTGVFVFTGVSSATAGAWNMYAVADNKTSPGDVSEYNETNNVAGPQPVVWRAANLTVLSVTPSNASPTVGDAINVSVAVRNEGNADAGSFLVALFYDEPVEPTPGGAGDLESNVSGLAAGQQTIVTFTGVTNATEETWQMYVIADNGLAVNESDEGNNVEGPTQVVWNAAATYPDLVVTAITPSSNPAAAGGTIDINVTVENQGTAAVGAFRVDLFKNRASAPAVGQTGDMNSIVAGLAVGISTEVVFADVTSPVPATWSAYAIVDTLNGVNEGDAGGEGNNVHGPASIAWVGADLVIISFTPSATSSLINSPISVTATVKNQGNADAGAFEVGLFYNQASPPTPGASGDETAAVPSLAQGAQTPVTFTGVTSAVPGQWSMYAVADNHSPDQVDEYDETNNIAGPQTVTWKAPDLVIVSVTPSNASPTVEDTISVSVVVRNQGDAAAGAFVVGLFENEAAAPTPGSVADRTANVSTLVAGGQTTLTFNNVTNATEETWSMYAVADNGLAAAESNENNNVGGPSQVIWNAAATFPNLVVTAITPSSNPATAGSTISITVTVENQGDAAVGSFSVDLFKNRPAAPVVGDTGDASKAVAGLEAGASTSVVFSGITSAVPATWATYAIVDTLDGVDEGSGGEGNNVYGPTSIAWRGVDLLITSFAPSAGTSLIGSAISVTATVRNQGNADAGAFAVGLFYNRASPPTPGAVADRTEPVASLAQGASTVVTFADVTSAVPGQWAMYAVADNASPGQVSEYNETNNVAGPQAVTWKAPDLQVVSITPENSSPQQSNIIYVDVVVRNAGDAASIACDVGLFDNLASAPAPGTPATWTLPAGALAAGEQATIRFPGITSASFGTWHMYAVADNALEVAESSEANNVAGPTDVLWTTGQPDLVIMSVSPSNANPSISQTISVSVTVKNQGVGAAGSFSVGLFLDESTPPTPGQVPDSTVTVISLAPGGQTVVSFTDIGSPVAAAWSTYAVADSATAVAESNEANNVSMATPITWHAPNLQIVSITPSNANPDLGTAISVDVAVRNVGDAAAGAFVAALFLNKATAPPVGGAADRTANVASLAAGTTTTVTFQNISSSASGAWAMYAAADNAAAVAESNEADNVGGPTAVIWHGADLVVAAITPSNATPSTAETISVNVTVTNLGDRAAGAFDVALFENSPAAPPVGSPPAFTQAVTSLAAGASQTVTFPGIDSSVAELWKTWAIADNGAAVPEGNEGNNVGGPVTITWGAPQLPDLAIVSVALLDAGGAPLAADPTEGDSISVAVDIVNNGTAAATSFEVGLYYNPGAAPEVGEPADRTKVVGSLAVGAQTALTFTGVTSPVAGLWRMYLLADSGGVVTESAEPNNVAGPVSVNWGGIAGIEVTAPNGGEAWQAGAAHRITWRSFGDIGSQDVRIDYSADGGASWNLIVAATRDDGVYDWTVPAEDSIRCLVRVTAAAGASPPSDESDGEFSIVPAGIGRPDLRVVAISPGANVYPVGTAIEIAVAVRNSGTAGAGFCRVDLFCDERSTAPAPGETGANYAWVDSPAPGSETTVVFGGITSNVTTNWNVYAVVSPVPMESDETNNVGGPVPIGWSDNPNAVNSLGLVSPNGGEVLEVGMACVVRWSLTGNPGSYVYLDVSLDGGATWQELERGLVTGARSYTWTVDVEPVAEARLRISNSLGTVTDVSDGVFTILPEGGNAPLYIGSGCASSLGRRCGAAGWLGLFLAALCLRCVARRPAGDKERPRE